MAKKRTLSTLSTLIAGLVGLGTSFYLLLHHEPSFYRRSFVEPGPEREQRSEEFMGQFINLLNKFKDGSNPSFDSKTDDGFVFSFTQEQLNSFFAEGFHNLGLAQDLSKLGIYEPRLTLEKDRMRVAFRYGEGAWATILSYDFKLWLAPKEPNLLVIEILGRKAGAVPIPSQQILQEISEMGRKHSVGVEWYRNKTNPAAVIRFLHDANQRPCAQFRQLVLEPGKILFAGRAFDPNQDVTVGADGKLK